ncbi:hypothetical protein [Lysobacter gummosus]
MATPLMPQSAHSSTDWQGSRSSISNPTLNLALSSDRLSEI